MIKNIRFKDITQYMYRFFHVCFTRQALSTLCTHCNQVWHDKTLAVVNSGLKIHTRMLRASKWAPTWYNKPSVHFPFSKNHNINTYSIDLLKGKCTEGLLYHVGAHLKALGILVWILGPESTTARLLLSQSWLKCACIIRKKKTLP